MKRLNSIRIKLKIKNWILYFIYEGVVSQSHKITIFRIFT